MNCTRQAAPTVKMASEGVNPDYITLFFALMCAAGESAQLI